MKKIVPALFAAAAATTYYLYKKGEQLSKEQEEKKEGESRDDSIKKVESLDDLSKLEEEIEKKMEEDSTLSSGINEDIIDKLTLEEEDGNRERFENQRKLISLEIDLELAQYEQGAFLLKQNLIYFDKGKQEKLINDCIAQNFNITTDHNICVSKIVFGRENVKPTIMSLFDRVMEDDEVYEGFLLETA